MRCYVCKATSKQFNNLELIVKQKVVIDNLSFGIPLLHAWIRFMEWFLHLAYKYGEHETDHKCQPRSEEQKQAVAARKQKIQNDFKGVSSSRTFKKGTFSQFSLKQKLKTLVKDFSHIFRYIFELVKKKFPSENKKKSRTYRRSRAACHHGQLILRA